jgi:hypothetical protein
MRRYEKDRMMLANCRKQMEEYLRKDLPTLSPSDVRKLAKGYVMQAYREMKGEVPQQRTNGVRAAEDSAITDPRR